MLSRSRQIARSDRRTLRDANDDAQISARRVVAALTTVRRELRSICDGCAAYEIKTVAQDLLDDLDNIEQSAGVVLAASVDVCGCEIHEPAASVAQAAE